MGGVYRIRNLVNGVEYIGSAALFKKRFREHRRTLGCGRHHSRYLQRAWLKYGADSFVFEILEEISDTAKLIEREQHWLDARKPGYNIAPSAGSQLGYRHSDAAKIKMRAAKIGKKLSAETCARMSVARIGNRNSLGYKHANRKSGYRHGDAAKAKIGKASLGNSYRLGKAHTPETKEKIRRGNLGKKASPESRARMSQAQRGRLVSSEARANMRAAALRNTSRLGSKASAETRAKMSASARNRRPAKNIAGLPATFDWAWSGAQRGFKGGVQ